MDRNHLAVRLHDTVARHAPRPATRIRVGDGWKVRTYAEFGADVRRVAAHLIALGVRAGDRVALFSPNRPEWSIADFACLTIRAVPVPIYATSPADQLRHIVADAGAVGIILDGESELGRLAEVWDDLPAVGWAIAFQGVPAPDARVRDWADLLADDPDPDAAAEIDARLAAASSRDLASIVYTSGTTGVPRGAMLTNRGFTFELDGLDLFFDVDADDSSLCFLPLSHALERAWTFFVLTHGCLNTYVPDARQVAEMMVLAQATLMASVPRLYEKVYLTAHQKVSGSPAKKAIFEWALRVGGQCQHAYRKGREPAPYWKAQLPLADKLVLSNIRDAMGGPKQTMACGGAPVRKEIEEFFSAVGMLLSSGYGLTEASPLISFNSPGGFKFGTAGRVLTGGEIKIADGGEILYRGPNVMEGYWNLPDLTAETLDGEGWLHTGDVGYLDTDGYLVITDRIKDIIVTAYGKNVAPAPIEGVILSDPLFEQAVVLGNNRPYLTLLVSPSMPHLEELAKQLQIRWADRSELFTNPAITDALRARVEGLTAKLASHEQIKDLRVLIDEFTLDNGLLTPTLKVKRKEVEKRFGQLIDDMYSKARRFRE